MSALKPTQFIGRIVWLGRVPDRAAALESQSQPGLMTTFAGPEGEAHGGLTRPACSRVKALYKSNTEIRNTRQLTLLSAEDLAATAAAFLGLSAIALTTKRDFSFMGKFLMIGMLVAVALGLGAIFFEVPALSLAVSGMVVLLSCGLILFETSRIVNGGETNYVMATVGLFVTIYNLFSSLLMLFGLGGSNDD